jgi:endoglucanase
MDAIGLMVSGIDQGLLHISEVGGVDHRILPGQLVTVHARRDLQGVVVAPPDRLLPPAKAGKPIEMEYLLVDTGLLEEEVKQLVRIGDLISFSQPPLDLPGNAIAGHSLDNRTAVAAVTACLNELQHITTAWDVWAVATVQEEETFLGATSSTFEIEPDLAIAIDVTFAKGPGANDYKTFPLGEGPTLGWGANIHPAIFKRFNTLAEQLDIPHAIEVMPAHSGTDAFGIQVVANGIPTMVIGIPLRYMHTPVEMISMKDIQRAGHLLAQFIAQLAPDALQTIRWDETE